MPLATLPRTGDSGQYLCIIRGMVQSDIYVPIFFFF